MTRLVSYPPAGGPSYSPTDRSWRYASSGPAPAWTPASIPGMVDFGIWSDLSRLYQTDGTTPVASALDPVGKWIGQLGVLTFIQTASGNVPTYNPAANGIRFGAGSAPARWMTAEHSRSADAPYTLVDWTVASVSGLDQRRGGIGFRNDTGFGIPVEGYAGRPYNSGGDAGFDQTYYVRGQKTNRGNSAGATLRPQDCFLSMASSGGAATGGNAEIRINDAAALSMTAGSTATATSHVSLNNSVVDSTEAYFNFNRKFWAVLSQKISAEDYELLKTWAQENAA